MTAPSRRRVLIGALALQSAGADLLRWPLTRAPARDAIEHELAHTVVTSLNWQREGALARHFVPSRSIDQSIPEWGYHDELYRNYLAVPLFGFILHYGVMRAVPWSSRSRSASCWRRCSSPQR